MAKGPILFDIEADAAPEVSVADAPPVPEAELPPPRGAAMQMAAKLSARPRSRLVRWFWGLAAALVGTVVSIAAWEFVTGLIASTPLLGYAVAALVMAFLVVVLALALREIAGFGRLARIDAIRREADAALASGTLADARAVTERLEGLYARREELRWGRERFAALQGDQLDPAALMELAEAELLGPLDAMATREVEAAARQVAAVTALVPLAFADVAAALNANLRMIRRIAEIYGGRSGTLGNWRLARAVMTHLVATGAVAAGDDMLEPILGGTILARLSRRFGEGLVNGALTARVGVAAMEVCRPVAFAHRPRPRVRDIVKRSLTGLFDRG
ncbi:TIGR01620 family protein [Sulfitobacter sp. D35]|uniref:YcjF family protein n=1 Tax=Sulfitobacter sp. D35 TaxID=3083252 RepID=UPI00296F85A5|nr:TIGR01620 family protein [Sulfitobacter sp. D35]MDW4499530.1 TIGR01620 family protein [Sulfitobacter sp. D35]